MSHTCILQKTTSLQNSVLKLFFFCFFFYLHIDSDSDVEDVEKLKKEVDLSILLINSVVTCFKVYLRVLIWISEFVYMFIFNLFV